MATPGKKRGRKSKMDDKLNSSGKTKVLKTSDGSEKSLIDLELSDVDEREIKSTEKDSKNKEGSNSSKKKSKKVVVEYSDSRLAGEPVPAEEARKRWPERYDKKKKPRKDDDEEALLARAHYLQAEVDGVIFNLYDDAYVKAEEGKPDYIGRIVEFFESTDKEQYFTAQWFFKAEDTVIQDHSNLIDDRRVFYSNERNDNLLDCILSKIKIVQVAPNIDLVAKEAKIPPCDFYYDMSYSLEYSTFKNLSTENGRDGNETSSTISSEASCEGEQGAVVSPDESSIALSPKNSDMTLLDLYSGCGGMSTGLCLGAALSGVNLVTRWAVDLNEYACQSLKFNHPETEVRNETAEDFLALLKIWKKLCDDFSLLGTQHSQTNGPTQASDEDEDDDVEDGSQVPSEEFEVGKLVGICYGDPNRSNKPALHFKVRWKGYGPSDDTWEPMEGLGKCEERLRDFVTNGYKSNILPLPGDVDVICGGPPCQGVSGFNRFRNKEKPLEDPKNHQLVVFMDIVNYLKPRYVLMENVVDIMKFSNGFLGRYALSSLVAMNYQARLGLMVAGCYGLPQFRMRVFLWGALPTEKLPQYPLPTHEVVARGFCPVEFEKNVVAYDEHHTCTLEKALHLGDAISDLPVVETKETRDEIPYEKEPLTEFQRHIRLSKHELLGAAATGSKASQKAMLYDHRPLQLNDDDFQRVCQIPKKKGANFRNLPGVLVGPDNKVELDKSVERVMLPSGKPLVPDYAITFVRGTSPKPFGRLWWDEIVPTVVTRAEPHNQTILHPEQDRVLSIRENARLQGFPDYYKLFGPVKERYIQVGNAVAVPVARVLGYALGLACQGTCSDQPLLTLPPRFPNSLELLPSATIDVQDANC
ncbi:Chromo domain/shadow [Macleaya cordata]|uniref:DNA (cytosine-5-)-methyltransferase n=1 Tax=Macleaya cordata TaxID=56857 RepID=A0A200RDC5_MACCD|nr:Chromo domain/shadow [Macleaya cordata]